MPNQKSILTKFVNMTKFMGLSLKYLLEMYCVYTDFIIGEN